MTVSPKPTGPIPQGFVSLGGELAVGGQTTTSLIEQAGNTPLFVYAGAMIEERMAALRHAFPQRLSIHYAVKANSFAPLLRKMSQLCDGLDIASAGELEQVRAAGADLRRVSFAGPGKRNEELEVAIAANVTLNLESEYEAERALAIGRSLGRKPRLAIRVNPPFELKGSGMKMGGGAKPFGIDVERVPALARTIMDAGCDWRGLHIFAGSQALDAAAIIETQGATLDLADKLAQEIGEPLPALNLGGGFGIPYFNGDMPLDIDRIGAALHQRMNCLPPHLGNTEFCLELGRYLVGEAGVYLARVVDRKESQGEVFLVTDGGLHHQLAASGNFGTVVRRNYPIAVATRFAEAANEITSVVGCLCTPLDRLADRAELPRAGVGDVIVVFCAGAYGASASPAAFLGHGPAAEMLV